VQIGKGCTIHQTKPVECSKFQCLWLYDQSLENNWRPDVSKCVFYYHQDGFIIAECGSENKHLIHESRYIAVFQHYAYQLESQGGYVIVHFGNSMYAVTPREIYDFGATRAAEKLRAHFDYGSRQIVTIHMDC
jgi:hypothetical protein